MWESYAEVARCVRLDRFFSYLPGDKNAFCGHKGELGGFVYIWKISSAEVNMLH